MALTSGQKAPAFTLVDTDKKNVSLSDFGGKNVVLLFFPLAFTGTCTKELCTVRDDLQRYNELNVQILAVSVDSLFVLGKFKQEQSINFPLLSDFNKETARAYGCLYDEFVFGMKGVAKRSAFVIDSNGIIRYAEVLESAGDLPDFVAIKAVLAEIK